MRKFTVSIAAMAAALTATVLWATAPGSSAFAEPPAGAAVNGLGGFFFRSAEPQRLAAWYQDNLGVTPVPSSYEEQPWMQEAGVTVFSPFPQNAVEFGPVDKMLMLNFRTRDLDGLVAHLRANGVKVEVDEEIYPNGRFARLDDPEGNPIQLWQPADPAK